jgi:dTMP kinase
MPAMERRKGGGLFVVLDGVDGCGKSTQARRLCDELERARGAHPLHLREPGGTPLGEALRERLLHGGEALSSGVELLLFAAARRQMLERAVAPALAAGRDVVCERSNASTFAYQAVAGGLDEERVLALLLTWCNDPAPDLLLWLDLPVDEACARLSARPDRIEARGVEFQRAVARGFARWGERVGGLTRVDARGGEAQVHSRILSAVRAHTPSEATPPA